MSKQFRNEHCAYCGVFGEKLTADHLIARALVSKERRGDIPSVPACEPCNNKKAKLEHYAGEVIPFGGRHADSHARLAEDVLRRLAQNAKTHRELQKGQSRVWSEESGLVVPAMTLPIDGAWIEELVGYFARGLMKHHWDIALNSDAMVEVHSMVPEIEKIFSRFLSGNPEHEVRGDIGNGALTYHGVRAKDNPIISVWEISLYGGLKIMEGDGKIATKFGVMTGPVAVQERVERFRKSGLVLP